MRWKRLLKKVGIAILIPLGVLVLGFLMSILTSLFPGNLKLKPTDLDTSHSVYIRTNGMHADLILPIESNQYDWNELLHIKQRTNNQDLRYVSFGWGDQGFYFGTPTWDDLSFKTAASALFWPTPSAMHVTGYQQVTANENTVKLKISTEQLDGLNTFVKQHLITNANEAICFDGICYGKNDLFFESTGKYSCFYTCNTWTNEALRINGLPSALWTPFDKGIFYHLRR
ncbi:MAG: hypothetical protein ACI8ZN_001022 [Bacteroidia bacterium]|jgi:uncharacterized protein (TIGR02117 family)